MEYYGNDLAEVYQEALEPLLGREVVVMRGEGSGKFPALVLSRECKLD